MRNAALHALFGLIAGLMYAGIEVAWRGYSHRAMIVVAGVIFVAVGLLNEGRRKLPMWQQVVIGTILATVIELIAGLGLNVWLGLGIWDYSHMPGNVMGQICPQFAIAWAALLRIAIPLEDLMHKAAD